MRPVILAWGGHGLRDLSLPTSLKATERSLLAQMLGASNQWWVRRGGPWPWTHSPHGLGSFLRVNTPLGWLLGFLLSHQEVSWSHRGI